MSEGEHPSFDMIMSVSMRTATMIMSVPIMIIMVIMTILIRMIILGIMIRTNLTTKTFRKSRMINVISILSLQSLGSITSPVPLPVSWRCRGGPSWTASGLTGEQKTNRKKIPLAEMKQPRRTISTSTSKACMTRRRRSLYQKKKRSSL